MQTFVQPVDLVIPTIGRSSLVALLASLERSRGPRPARIFIVDDRPDRSHPIKLGSLDADLNGRIEHLAGSAQGPAAARNIGWRASRACWVAFLDDDVVVDDDWLEVLAADVRDQPLDVAASYGRVRVPLPRDRKPTDWERNVAGLETATWITADCAIRRTALQAAGGFDERFPRAYREDSDLALRLLARGRRLITGRRRVAHPVRPAPWWISIRLQAGNADDILMRALHGPAWRVRAGAPTGAIGSHILTVVAVAGGTVAAIARRKRLSRACAGLWLLLLARFAWQRIAPGPRTAAEIATLALTSAIIPFSACIHRVLGFARLPKLLADTGRSPRPVAAAVLLDRDGTLIVDVPFNANPDLVVPMRAAASALERLRRGGVLTAIVSNQSGIGSGRLRRTDVDAVNARVEALLGPLGPIAVCPHVADDACACRKPRPGLIHEAAAALGVRPQDCVVIGDIGADIEAATAAGARAVLVPTPITRGNEIAAARNVVGDLDAAVELVLSGRV